MRIRWTLIFLCLAGNLRAQSVQSVTLPDAPSAVLLGSLPSDTSEDASASATPADIASSSDAEQVPVQAPDPKHGDGARTAPAQELDANGNVIPLDQRQPQRIFGFMPNFRSVSGGSKPHPPGWVYNFKIATRQSFDYSSFLFLGLTSISAEGINSHPALGKGVDGFYAYTWRGFLDKTDGTYLQAWLLPSLLHEDTRYYALGKGHSVLIRSLYVISRQGVTRTYGGSQTPNIAGLGGKVLTQIISRYYYPAGTSDFSVLATKFGYACMRDIAFTSIREFYPDIAAHYIRKHHEKAAQQAARDASSSTP